MHRTRAATPDRVGLPNEGYNGLELARVPPGLDYGYCYIMQQMQIATLLVCHRDLASAAIPALGPDHMHKNLLVS